MTSPTSGHHPAQRKNSTRCVLFPPDVLARVEQKLRLEANYNSNAIEGNTLTYGETRSLILHGLTAQGKPLRDHLDIEGHDTAVKAIEDAISDDRELNEVFIRNLHRILLKEPYEKEAKTPEGQRVIRIISIGDYKTTPNNVRTSTGETYYLHPSRSSEVGHDRPHRLVQDQGARTRTPHHHRRHIPLPLRAYPPLRRRQRSHGPAANEHGPHQSTATRSPSFARKTETSTSPTSNRPTRRRTSPSSSTTSQTHVSTPWTFT